MGATYDCHRPVATDIEGAADTVNTSRRQRRSSIKNTRASGRYTVPAGVPRHREAENRPMELDPARTGEGTRTSGLRPRHRQHSLFSQLVLSTMDTLRLGLEWFLNPDHVPLLLAQEHGWLADAGIDLEVIEPAEHLDAVDAIEDGTMDLAITEPLHLVEDRAEGRPVVGFARFLHTNGGVMYRTDTGIERPRDMADGVRIQYPGAPGPGGPAIVGTMIEADGGTVAPDAFTPVNNGFYHTDALAEDDADVATLAFYNFELVEARHRGLDVDFFALKDWGVPDFCQLILITTPELLDAWRDVLERFVRVLQRGIDVVHQHPDEARRVYRAHTETDPDDALTNAVFDATVPCFTYDFAMTRRYYDRLEHWLHDRGLIDATPGADAYWTNDLVLPAPARAAV